MSRQISTYVTAVVFFMAGNCIVAQEQAPPTPQVAPLPNPKLKSMGSVEDFYPPTELRQGHTGYALIEYSINGDGRPIRINIVETIGAPFGEWSSRIFSGYRYAVPSDWVSKAGPEQRFQIQFHFNIPGYPIVGGHSGVVDMVISANPDRVRR